MASSSAEGAAVITGMSRYICLESAHIISVFRALAREMEKAVFPEAVAPEMTASIGFFLLSDAKSDNTAKRVADLR